LRIGGYGAIERVDGEIEIAGRVVTLRVAEAFEIRLVCGGIGGAVGPAMGVKASGGIRTLEDLKNMAAAGATRIGASASVKIVSGDARSPSKGYS
jgi:deoxyribose-phosphate aldolase